MCCESQLGMQSIVRYMTSVQLNQIAKKLVPECKSVRSISVLLHLNLDEEGISVVVTNLQVNN